MKSWRFCKYSTRCPNETNDEKFLMPARNKTSLPRRVIGKLGLVLFGLLFGCLLFEIVLRVAGYSYPEFYQPDEVRGYALRPNMNGWYRKEGAAYIRINADGLRDREHAVTKPAGTIRIAVIGDSYPEALPVNIEDAFWSVMAGKIEQCGAFGSNKIEVINFGVSGYGTTQELLTLRDQVWKYSPDVVMLTVTTNNDISDNLRELKKTDQVPYFLLREGKLSLDDSFRNTSTFRWRMSAVSRLGRWIRDHSRVIQAVNQGHHGFKIWLAARKARNAAVPAPTNAADSAANSNPASEELGIDNVVYREPADQVWNDAWGVTEKLILQMRDEVQSKGAKFVVVTLTNGIQVYPDPAVRQIFMKRVGVNDLFYPDNRVKSFSAREHVPSITLVQEMQAYADQNKVFLHGFGNNQGNGHWNLTGHRIAGESIARQICGGLLK
ncbi:MAG TPA: SGNH/GDSL hydrolase family protein [Pyrinomonadaceae bacterium]|nr:SGNH/GDSL hydrolase family protein [Pyrinomonadaceae bacterium]